MPGRTWIYILLVTACSINYIDRVVLSVSAQPIAKEFGISTIQLGYLFSAFLWSYLVFVLPWGTPGKNEDEITPQKRGEQVTELDGGNSELLCDRLRRYREYHAINVINGTRSNQQDVDPGSSRHRSPIFRPRSKTYFFAAMKQH